LLYGDRPSALNNMSPFAAASSHHHVIPSVIIDFSPGTGMAAMLLANWGKSLVLGQSRADIGFDTATETP
jgi:hypothetical protein